jgi:uncharacterized MAPEG superfamily protein
MTTELWLLVANVILGLVHLIAASHVISCQYGYRWIASSREEPVPPLRGLANRVDQATTNFLKTFPFFAAVVLVAHVTQHHSLLTFWGAHLYAERPQPPHVQNDPEGENAIYGGNVGRAMQGADAKKHNGNEPQAGGNAQTDLIAP